MSEYRPAHTPPPGSLPPPSPVPPPPPPDLTAAPPAGGPLRRIGPVGRAASVLVIGTGVVSVVGTASAVATADDARRFLDGEISDTDFIRSAAPYALLSLVQLLSLIASAIVVIVWMYRMSANLRALRRDTTWGPGWTIGGWFTPPVVFVIPFLVLRELWKASGSDVSGGQSWKSNGVTPLITVWFVLFGVVQAVLQALQIDDTVAGFGPGEDVLAEQLAGDLTVTVIAAVTDLAAAVVFATVVVRLGHRHRRLTGEDVH